MIKRKSWKNGFSFILFGWCAALTLGLVSSGVAFAGSDEKKVPAAESLRSVYEAEKLLSERGYWISKIDDIMDPSTRHAIAAFQKVERRKRTGILTIAEIRAMRRSKRPKPLYTGAAHVEIDIKRQVLFLVNDEDLVTHILPVSTGSGKTYYQDGRKHFAKTPRGIFKITRQIKGVRRAPLGVLYHPNYFHMGVAIHGSDSIPFHPASHGCVRIPRFASKKFSDLVRVGLPVIVHEKFGSPQIQLEKEERLDLDAVTMPVSAPCK
ncbi:MAG: murein L,D-transpeptidase [Pyrinomonadaceae bacterium]|nr:murein L,D-transpeptidase [Pyrinomonadaceae bacterium]